MVITRQPEECVQQKGQVGRGRLFQCLGGAADRDQGESMFWEV